MRGTLALALSLAVGCTTWEELPIVPGPGSDAETTTDGTDIPDAAGPLDAAGDGEDPDPSDGEGGDAPAPDGDVPPEDAGDGVAPAPDAGPDTRIVDDVEPGGCVTPTAGMMIGTSVEICPGSHEVADPSGAGAVRVVASGVTIDCGGARLVGAGGGSEAQGTGWRLDDVSDVTLIGCGATGFRYGLVASGGSGLALTGGNYRGNFDDPDAATVLPPDVGGGVRLEGVDGASLSNLQLGNNFNGLELVDCDAVQVSGVNSAPTSNAGALLIRTRGSTLQGSTFSRAARGASAADGDWVGAETFGAAGVWLDSGASLNTIEGNTIAECGAGVAVRDSALGAGLPARNKIRNNTITASAVAGVWVRCDDNDATGNTIDGGQFGVWIDGAGALEVRGNTISGAAVDGISIQGGPSRRLRIRGNSMSAFGRAGLLLAGKRYDAGVELGGGAGQLFNTSHALVEANAFDGSGGADIFVAWVRGVVVVSNCGEEGGLPAVQSGPQAGDVFAVGDCLAPDAVEAVTAALAPVSAVVGEETSLDATGTSSAGELPLTYYWLVQPRVGAWGQSDLPTVPLNGAGPSQVTVPIGTPGLYEANLIAYNSTAASLAHRNFTLVPSGKDWAEGNPEQWVAHCTGSCDPQISADPTLAVVGQSSIRVDTDASLAFWTGVQAPAGEVFDLVGGAVGFFVRVDNPNQDGWQGNFPRLELVDGAGNNRFVTPSVNLLGDAQGAWRYIRIPVDGDPPNWVVANGGVKLGEVTRVHIYTDTFGTLPYTLWFDGFTIEGAQ